MKAFGFPFGISTTFWAIVGLIRMIGEAFTKKKRAHGNHRYQREDIAAIIPAHNEELVIRRCIQALKTSVNPKQIYVVSDGSKDRTYRRARMEGVHVSNLLPGQGKAKALVYVLSRYKLFQRYNLIFIVDADTRIDTHCVKRALPLFDDPDTGVIFAKATIPWPQHIIPRLKYYFIAYRERLNRILQYTLVYGQTWKYTNVNFVIPGFATIYRSDVLRQLEIDTPGLLIEDFNLAFQFHKKKVGKIGYNPAILAWDQHPDNLRDYWKQVQRWNIGFFQTVKMNGIWTSFFWLSLGVFSIEVLLHALFLIFLTFVMIDLLILFFLSSWFPNVLFPDALGILAQHPFPFYTISWGGLLFGLFLIDYCVTVVIGLINKKPQLLFYGLFFYFMHAVTALILVTSVIPGFFGSSSGRWVSPTRRAE